MFATGSHIGEIILWDSINWTVHAYEHILQEETAGNGQSEIMIQQKQNEMSIQHMHSNGEVCSNLSFLCMFEKINRNFDPHFLKLL